MARTTKQSIPRLHPCAVNTRAFLRARVRDYAIACP
jgi:hypothetical protein